MNPILARYDAEQRQQVQYYGLRSEQTPEVVRLVALEGGAGAVVYSRLDESNADRVIREQIAYFESLGQDFEWKLFDYDTPADLRARLAAQGFEIDDAEAIMVLDLETAPESLFEPVTADLRRLTDPAQLDPLLRLLSEVWEEDQSPLGEYLAAEMSNQAENLSIYMAYVEDIPASAAWIRFDAHSQFAGLWGGSTLAAYRKRGLYTALMAIRAQDARQRGVRYLTIDASPMSAPIARKHGFQQIATAWACNWTVNRD